MANKADLVRNREIKSSKGKQMAMKYGVKYIETSPGKKVISWKTKNLISNDLQGINHNIDELLVGTYTQITLRQKVIVDKEYSKDKVPLHYEWKQNISQITPLNIFFLGWKLPWKPTEAFEKCKEIL